MAIQFEEQLQDALALRPDALSTPAFPGSRLLLGREISVRDEPAVEGPLAGLEEGRGTGRMDVVMAEADGLPVVVEAKLHRNRDMADVVGQAVGYARAMAATPDVAVAKLRASLGRVSGRDPGSPGVFKAVRALNPDWGPDDLRAAMLAHLAAGRCRVVVVADAIPEAVVRAAVGSPPPGGITLGFFNAALDRDGLLAAHPLTDAGSYRCTPPTGGVPSWVVVPRKPVDAKAFMADPVKDRFYAMRSHAEFRVERIGYLPARLWFEAAPGRAPAGDLHQVEKSRPEGCAPAMPNLRMLQETGNPYPADGGHRSVLTDPAYRPVVAVCHHAWRVLARQGHLEFGTPGGLDPRLLAGEAKVPLQAMSPNVQRVALAAPLHAMLDCALFGLVRHSRRAHGEHRFELLQPPTDLVAFR